MSIYWRSHPDLPDVDLPQTIMRPFWHPETIKLDDKQFCIYLDHDRPAFAAGLTLVISFAVIALACLQFYGVYTAYSQQNILSDKLYTELAVASGLALLAFSGFYLFYLINQARYICFRRDTHSVYYPRQGLIPRYQELNYDEFRGAIRNLKNIFGKRQSVLALNHNDRRQSITLTSTTDNPQSLAGFWSFIVQYMKVDGPLPDVPALHQYPNKTPGVIHQNTIDYS